MKSPVALLFAIILSAFVTPASPCRAAELHVGAAAVDITPKPGDSHYRGTSGGVHDKLHAKAMVFRQGDMEAALVVCDVIGVRAELTGPTRELASEKTGIPFENLVIAATHTHTGPRNHNDLTPGDDTSYAARVRDGIVQAIATAKAGARTAVLEAGVALQRPVISFNRRFHMQDGSVRMNPGFENPDIVRAEGPVDPEVGFLLVRDAETGDPFASLANFAMHLDTVGGDRYSADYPYYIEQFLQGKYGPDFVSVFGTGCCGNINHIDVTRPGPQRGHDGGYQSTKYIGEQLSATIETQIPQLEEVEPALAVQRTVVDAPLQRYTAEEIAWAKSQDAAPLVDERPFLQRMRRGKLRSLERLRERWGESMPLDVHVIRLGSETAIVTLPGEVFVELGMAIKTASPFEHTLVIELAGDSPAYIPTRAAFVNGDYEAVNSRLAPGGGERLVQAAVRMLFELDEDSRDQQP